MSLGLLLSSLLLCFSVAIRMDEGPWQTGLLMSTGHGSDASTRSTNISSILNLSEPVDKPPEEEEEEEISLDDKCNALVPGSFKRDSSWRRWWTKCKCMKGTMLHCGDGTDCQKSGRYFSLSSMEAKRKNGVPCECKFCATQCGDVVEDAVFRNSAWRRSVKCKCPVGMILSGKDVACHKGDKRTFATKELRDKGCSCIISNSGMSPNASDIGDVGDVEDVEDVEDVPTTSSAPKWTTPIIPKGYKPNNAAGRIIPTAAMLVTMVGNSIFSLTMS